MNYLENRPVDRRTTCKPARRSALPPSPPISHGLSAAAMSLLLIFGLAPRPARAQETPMQISIAAQPLANALVQLANKYSLELAYAPGIVAGLDAPAVAGNVTADQALRQMLAGTGIEFTRNGRNVSLRKALQPQGAVTLPEIRVKGRHDGDTYSAGQLARSASLGALGNTDIMDAPFSVVSYTESMINDAQARTIGEVLTNDSSVRTTGQANGVSESFSIRGFPINEGNIGDVMFDGLYGIAPNYTSSAIYAERVELIKGPTALLNGIAPNGSIGGSLNIVPKRAADKPLTRLTLDYESKSQFGALFDVGRRFGEDHAWGIRVNGQYQQGDTARDHQSAKSPVGSVALDYRGDKLRASLDYIDQRFDVDAPVRQPSLAAGAALPAAPNPSRNLDQSWEYSRIHDQAVLLRGSYEFNPALTAYAAAGVSEENLEGFYGNPVITSGAGDVQIQPARIGFKLKKETAEVGLRGTFSTGSIDHSWSLAANRYHDHFDVGFSFSPTTFNSNLYSPANTPAVSLANPEPAPYSRSTLEGVALTDTMSFLHDRVLLTAGVRHQNVRSESPSAHTVYDESAVTPMAGIVFKVAKPVSLYANYIQGLAIGDTAPTSAINAGEVFAPYKSEQYEVGVKYEGQGWMASAAAFQISKPSGQLDANGYYRPNAEQRNRGLELNAVGAITRGLRTNFGITLIDPELTKGSAAIVGNDAPGVPHLQAVLGLEWDVPALSGLTLSGRLVHSGPQYADQANTQRLPAWNRLDLGAKYATRLFGKHVVYRASISNVTDRRYWSSVTSWGGLAIGEPRTVRLSMQMDF
ncbi:TonB-dependent siderophore receptor [Candidimonas nitroreducens]|uniref:TonB-dependent siderophore receptor n=1 Tax=Candidimonas nitroreducens TaxID=683354 RepID=A0A225MGA5_9BURK|nr:TonB-dependent siderophore receptor [Candidimonas nitroreducens]